MSISHAWLVTDSRSPWPVTSLLAQEPAASAALAHTRTEFRFTVEAPFEQTAPLFGADEERKWSPDWNPQFVYPEPAHDQPGHGLSG